MKNKKTEIFKTIIQITIFVILGALIGLVCWNICKFERINRDINDTLIQLKLVSDSKKNQIVSYMESIKKEEDELANFDGTKFLLKQPLTVDDAVVKIDVDEKALIIEKEIENYIRTNPKKTLKDLQNDELFQAIAVQTIGKDGYSLVEDSKNLSILFHKNKDLIDQNYESYKNKLPELYNLLVKSKTNSDTSGYYDWIESDGTIRRKYSRVMYLDIKTEDGVSLVLATTGYVDNYKVIQNVFDKESLNYFNKNIDRKDFGNLFLISPDGYVVFVVEDYKNLGTNLNWDNKKNSELAKIFLEAEINNKINMSDVFIDQFGSIYPQILEIKPVYEEGTLLGYVALEKRFNLVFDITKKVENLGETGESYLVKKNGDLLISPLRLKYLNIFVQNINTENINNCFENKKNITNTMIGYDGEKRIGINTTIPETRWCMATEIKESEVVNMSFGKELFVSIMLFLLFSLVGFLITIRKKKTVNKERKLEKILKNDIFFTKLKFRYSVLFSLIFIIGYFFLITYFFQGWQNADFYNDIPDLFTAFTLMMLFFYGFKLKNISAKKLILTGSLLAMLDKLIQIILEEYNYKFGVISTYFWLPGAITGFIGLFLIFYGFKKEREL